jgi:hypothetical protein
MGLYGEKAQKRYRRSKRTKQVITALSRKVTQTDENLNLREFLQKSRHRLDATSATPEFQSETSAFDSLYEGSQPESQSKTNMFQTETEKGLESPTSVKRLRPRLPFNVKNLGRRSSTPSVRFQSPEELGRPNRVSTSPTDLVFPTDLASQVIAPGHRDSFNCRFVASSLASSVRTMTCAVGNQLGEFFKEEHNEDEQDNSSDDEELDHPVKDSAEFGQDSRMRRIDSFQAVKSSLQKLNERGTGVVVEQSVFMLLMITIIQERGYVEKWSRRLRFAKAARKAEQRHSSTFFKATLRIQTHRYYDKFVSLLVCYPHIMIREWRPVDSFRKLSPLSSSCSHTLLNLSEVL